MRTTTENFYTDTDISINSNEYDIVFAFFKKVIESEKSAEEFTKDLFRVAYATKVPVLNLLESMNEKDKIGINETMAFYLNQIRSQSALLGVLNTRTANQNVARNILS